jgi:hypothetical protein
MEKTMANRGQNVPNPAEIHHQPTNRIKKCAKVVPSFLKKYMQLKHVYFR